METQTLLEKLTALEPTVMPREKSDCPAITISPELLLGFMKKLKAEPSLAFNILCTHTAIDWIAENRFELIYQLYSLEHAHSLRVSTSVPRDNPLLSSMSSIWRIAQWQEREVYDLFGVLYHGHPDLRRLFLEDDWKGFPLRKDYQDDFMLEKPEWA